MKFTVTLISDDAHHFKTIEECSDYARKLISELVKTNVDFNCEISAVEILDAHNDKFICNAITMNGILLAEPLPFPIIAIPVNQEGETTQ